MFDSIVHFQFKYRFDFLKMSKYCKILQRILPNKFITNKKNYKRCIFIAFLEAEANLIFFAHNQMADKLPMTTKKCFYSFLFFLFSFFPFSTIFLRLRVSCRSLIIVPLNASVRQNLMSLYPDDCCTTISLRSTWFHVPIKSTIDDYLLPITYSL